MYLSSVRRLSGLESGRQRRGVAALDGGPATDSLTVHAAFGQPEPEQSGVPQPEFAATGSLGKPDWPIRGRVRDCAQASRHSYSRCAATGRGRHERLGRPVHGDPPHDGLYLIAGPAPGTAAVSSPALAKAVRQAPSDFAKGALGKLTVSVQ
jgi:hypothetical protein